MYLEKKGANYWACCPFHNEKTPSFSVNPQKGFYKCFGCGVSGNAITFLIEHEKMTYPEAIRYLADMVNMKVPEEEETEESKARRLQRERGYDALRKAALFYVKNLYGEDSQDARAYIQKRGLSPDTLKAFGIGCSLDFYSMPHALKEAGVSVETMRYAGLLGQYNGNDVDFEARRLVIPIIDHKGKVVGFGGRVLGDADRMKYKNTQATDLFDKSRTLFGLNMMKKLQKTEPLNYLILVEGYMDVISLYQAGFKNAVASMGTSLTPEQCGLLKRYVNTVYVSYDGDSAGRKATFRSLDLLQHAGLEVRVVHLPDGLDPDDTIQQLGADGYRKLLDEAKPLIEYKIFILASRYDLNTLDGKNKFATAVLPVLAGLNEMVKGIYIQEVSRMTGLTEESILNSAARVGAEDAYREEPKAQEKTEEIPAAQRANIIAARFLLSVILHLKSFVDIREMKEEFFVYPPHAETYRYIRRCISNAMPPVPGNIYDFLPEAKGEAEKIINAVNTVPAHRLETYYGECLRVLTKDSRERSKKELIERIKNLPEGEEKNNLKEELRKLTKKI